MGFGDRWIRWIRFSFSTVKYSVLVNRSPVGFLSPKRGIRQRDPLSPFLFIFAMEGLSRMFDNAKEFNWSQGFEVGTRTGQLISLSYLLFAGDTLTLCRAERSQVQYINITLMHFEALKRR